MISLVIICALTAEPKCLFEKVDESKVVLTTKQAKTLADAKGISKYKSHIITKFNKDALNGRSFCIPTKNKDLIINDFNIDKKEEHAFVTWGHSLIYIGYTDSVSGLIYDERQVFWINPMSEGLYLIVEVDHSKFEDHPPK